MSLESKAKTLAELQRPDGSKDFFFKQWVPLEEVYKKLTEFREDELFRIHCEIDNYKPSGSEVLKEVINTFDSVFVWEKQPQTNGNKKTSQTEVKPE